MNFSVNKNATDMFKLRLFVLIFLSAWACIQNRKFSLCLFLILYYTTFSPSSCLFGLRGKKASVYPPFIDASAISLIANADCPLWVTLKSRLLNITHLWVLNLLSQVLQHSTASWCRQCMPAPPPLTRTNAHCERYNFTNGRSNLLNQTDVLVGIWKGSQALTQG